MFENLTLAQETAETPASPGELTNLTLSLTENKTNPVTGPVAKDRATRAHFGLGKHSPGVEVLENAISTGNEDRVREDLTNQITADSKTKVIAQLAEAGRKGEPVDPTKVKIPVYNPSSILEDRFADQFVVETIKDSASMKALQAQNPAQAEQLATGFGVAVARGERLKKLFQDQKAENERLGTGWHVWYFAKQVVPAVSSVNKTDNIGQAMLSGSQMLEDRKKFWSFKSNDEAIAWARQKAERAKSGPLGNPLDAEEWLRNLISYSREDAFVANMIDGLDSKSVAGVAVGTAKIGAALAVKNLMKSTVKSLDDPMFNMTSVYAAKGDLEKAATETVKGVLAEADPMGMGRSMNDALTRLNNPASVFRMFGEPLQLQNDRAEKMIKVLDSTALAGTKAAVQGHRAQRVAKETLDTIGQETQDRILRENPNINDSVIGFQRRYVQASNTYFEEAIIGQRDGTLFKSAAAANRYGIDELGLDFERFHISKETPSMLDANRSMFASPIGKPEGLQPPARSFKTAKGSSYKINEDGTTTRTKGHADAGLKPTSAKTVYVRPEDAARLAPPEGSWRYAIKDGTLSLITRTHEQPWGKIPSASDVAFSQTPQKGMVPVELWNSKKLMGHETYGKVHFGNNITDITTASKKEFGYEVVQHGEGYYISIVKPYDETSDLARAMLIPNSNKNPVHVGSYLLERIKGAESILSPLQRENRHKVTHIPQVMFEVIEDIAKIFPRMRKDSFKQLDKILERNANTHYKDPKTGELVRGQVYANQSELEKAWKDANGRYPDEIESLAYWTYHQIMDLDWVVRNLGVHRDLSRQGVEVQVVRIGEQPVEFHGRFEREFPKHTSGNPGILFIERGSPEPKHYYLNKIKNTDTIKFLEDLVNTKGYKVLQVANPEDRPLSKAINKGVTVNYVITNDSTSKPLPFKLVDYNPGVHILYPHTNFVKQIMVETGERGLTRYYGDKTVFGFFTEKEAKNFAVKLDELRLMMLRKADDATMSSYIEKNLPKDLDYWKKQFDAKDGYLSVDHPIHHTQSGQTIMESYPQLKERYKSIDGDDLIVERNTEHNLYRSIDMDFLANRDGPLQTISRSGSKEKPLYDLRKAETLDPMIALQRTIGNSVTSLINNDYKIGAIEQWFTQYKHLLSEKARNNPYSAFYDKSALNENAIKRAELASARESRERVLGFLGTRSERGKDIDAMQQRIMDRLGEKGAKWYSEHELRLLKDPVGFTRSAMFDIYFGFFNPAQYPIQASGMFHVMGLAGAKHGGAGFGAFMIQKAGMHLTDHPETLQRYAQMARAVGWKPDDFLESYKLMKQLGYDKVGREHALDTAKFEPEFGSGIFRRFMKGGRYFFNEGERLTRMTAWNTAYHEWRTANPGKAIDTFTEGKIIARADDLALNMTRASHSTLQEGWKSIPTMYLTFSHRIMEQFWSGRIDKKERLRAALTHGALWGVPAVVGAATFYPFYDNIRQDALAGEKSIWTLYGSIDRKSLDTWYGRLAMDGALSSLVSWATGKQYNIGPRYGVGPGDLVSKWMDAELSAGDLIAGPPGSLIESAWGTLFPAKIGAMVAMKSGDGYEFVAEDVISVFRELKGPNNIWNAIMALNAGKYISKQGTLVAQDLDTKDAIAIMGGLTPLKMLDERLLRKYMKEHTKVRDKIGRFATDEIVKGYTASGVGDFEGMARHFNRAEKAMKTYGDFSDKDYSDVWRKARDSGKDQIERTEQRLLEVGTKEQLTKRHRQLLGLE